MEKRSHREERRLVNARASLEFLAGGLLNKYIVYVCGKLSFYTLNYIQMTDNESNLHITSTEYVPGYGHVKMTSVARVLDNNN